MLLEKQAKDEIVKQVKDAQGCKVMELIPKLSKELIYQFDVMELIDELIEENALCAIEYTTLEMPYRSKLFLLPPCDSVTVIKSEKL